MIRQILDKAKAAGACALADRPTTWSELAALFFSPQGLEFCVNNAFPDAATCAALQEHASELAAHNIYVNRGRVRFDGCGSVAFIGDTFGEVHAWGATSTSRIVCLAGASADVQADGYAVVACVSDAASHITVTKNETAIVL